MSSKDDIRKRVLADRVALAPEKVQELSTVVQERVLKSAFWPKSGRVGLYASVKNEVLAQDLFRQALEQGLHVYFPRVEQGIRFYEVNGPEDLQRGSWSIPEPKIDCPQLSEEEGHHLDLLIVPGIAFTKSGLRVGYGKGFYDQYIARYPGKCVGMAYEFQMQDNIPADTWDRQLSGVFTEKNLYQPAKQKD
jgi:5-formyltetrahydrofolate cyclo-ligase